MYLDHFRFNRPPFSLTPDPSFLFLSRDHREGLAHLLYGVGETGGFVQLTGEVGTGKTTLCRFLLDRVPENVDLALILNPRQTDLELLANICDELDIDYPENTDSIKVLVDRLNRHLLACHSEGRRTVLVIDEAQNLSAEVLEQIRLLTNLETPTTKLLQILLIGQPELKAMMEREDLRQLDQRITARYHLTTLSREETRAYIHHRLTVAGGRPDLFTAGAVRCVHDLSRGIPRLINILCDRALLGAYSLNRGRVDRATVKTAEREVRGKAEQRRGHTLLALGTAALILAAVGVGIGFYRQPKGGLAEDRPAQALEPSAPSAVQMEPLKAATPIPPLDLPPKSPPTDDGAPPARDPNIPPAVAIVDAAAERLATAPVLPPLPPPPSEAVEPLVPVIEGLGNLLETEHAGTRLETAFGILLGYWHNDWETLPGSSGCVKALAAGLQCLEIAGGLADLRAYNRPAVLEIYDARQAPRHVVVSGLTGNTLLLDLGDEKRLVEYDAIAGFWSGRFTVLWRPPPLSQSVLAQGMRGTDVLWLRSQLDRVAELPAGSAEERRNPVFDNGLKDRVMAFQQRRQLRVDGVVGQRTLIELNAAAQADAPALTDALPTGQEG